MNMRLNVVRVLVLIICIVALTACNAWAQFSGPALSASTPVNRPVTPTTDPALLFPPNREIHLGPGDLIMVHVYGAPDYLPTARVSIDGSVQLPPDLLDALPPGSLAKAVRTEAGVELRRADVERG